MTNRDVKPGPLTAGRPGVNRFPRGSVKPSGQDRILMAVEPDLNGGCWLWSEAVNRAGYGRVCGYPEGLAHRLSYRAFRGDPTGLFVCHRCDVPACVNPDHLWLGTRRDNMADMARKGRGTRNAGRVGSASPRAKLNEQLVLEIRASPLPNKQVAHQYRVSIGTIEKIRSGSTWSHV